MSTSKESREAADKARRTIEIAEEKNDLMIRFGLNNPKGCPYFLPDAVGGYYMNSACGIGRKSFHEQFEKWLIDHNKKNYLK